MQLQLNAQKIYEKDFKTGLRGYNPDEVDNFLDMVIEDYRQFELMLRERRPIETPNVEMPKLRADLLALQQENRRLQQELATVKQELQRAKNSETQTMRRTQPSVPGGTTNFDILQRLSNLEKHVFGSRLDQE